MTEMTDTQKLTAKTSGIKLVISDMDGTLLNQQGELSQATIEAVKKLSDKGILFGLATGRAERRTRVEASLLSVSTPVIACNGALIRESTGERRVLYSKAMSAVLIRTLAELSRQYQLDFLFYALDTIYYTEGSRKIHSSYANNVRASQLGVQPCNLCLMDERYLPQEECFKCLLVLPEEERLKLEVLKCLNELDDLEVAISMNDAVDLMAEGVNKGDAVRFVADYLALRLDEIACAGDQRNDLTMLQAAGLAIVMGNADTVVRQEADYLTLSNQFNGLAVALNYLF